MIFAIFTFGWYFLIKKFPFPYFFEVGVFLADIFDFIGMVQLSNTIWGYSLALSKGHYELALSCTLAIITMILIPADLMRDFRVAAYKHI